MYMIWSNESRPEVQKTILESYVNASNKDRVSLASAGKDAGIELFVMDNAYLKFSTIENWSKNLLNLNTKLYFILIILSIINITISRETFPLNS